MQRRRLADGLEVSAIGLGAMALTQQNYGVVDEDESLRALHAAIDAGVTLVDTANTYGDDNSSELFLGAHLADRRSLVMLSSKVGLEKIPGTRRVRLAGHPDTLRASCEASLGRLATDHLDVYYLHRANPAYPVAEVWGRLAGLVEAGLVRHLGMSEPSIESLTTAHALHPVAVVQSEYSLFSRDIEAELLPALERLGIGLVCFAPLGRGVLTGSIRSEGDFGSGDIRQVLPRFTGENLTRNVATVDRLDAMAERLGCTKAQLALAWILAKSAAVPIPGMETRAFVADNVAAAGLSLSADDVAEVEAAVPGAVGERYNDEIAQLGALTHRPASS